MREGGDEGYCGTLVVSKLRITLWLTWGAKRLTIRSHAQRKNEV